MVAVTASPHVEAIPGWHVSQAYYPPIAAGESTKRNPIFTAPFRCELGEVAIINSTLVSGANTNTVHLNLINGGSEGAGTTELDTIDLVSGTDLIVGKTLLFDNIQGASAEVFLTQGDILELESEEIGTGLGAAINAFMLYIVFRPANLSS
tara:strand:- start:7803 stop:8255 length:453 start_codon:yes stop_codon:yes gene_type:complete